MNTITDASQRIAVHLVALRATAAQRHQRGTDHDERGEGVISAAIAVLIMAFIGVAAFAAFKSIMNTVTDKAEECVTGLGGVAATC
jgi:hypothetical protein